MKFYKKVSTSDDKPSRKVNWWKVIFIALITVIVFGALLYIGTQTFGFYKHVTTNWEEIKFAYNKPVLVKAIRSDYETKQNKLESSYLERKQTSEQKLIDEVVKQIQSSK